MLQHYRELKYKHCLRALCDHSAAFFAAHKRSLDRGLATEIR